MNAQGEDEDYWNVSDSKAYNFDEDDVTSEASYEDFPQSDFPLNLLISDQDLQMILEEQSRQDVLPRNVSQEEELRFLRRKFQEERNPPPASVILSRLLIGRHVQLEVYKTLAQKTELLDEAIASGSGDAILRVVLFLNRTLKRRIVYQLLQSRPEAVSHFTNYLSTRLQVQECVDLWTMLGKPHEAAMLQYRLAVSTSNADLKRRKLSKVHNDYFLQPGAPIFHTRFVSDQLSLLEWQATEALADKTVLESLYHACERHKWTDSKSLSPGNPYNMARKYQISASQFEWIALNERARSKAWKDLDALFERKTFIKSSFAIHIPLDKVVLRLHQLEAPVPVLNAFLARIDDTPKRLTLARKVGAVRSVIDCLVALKDKAELLTVRNSLEQGTPDRFYADNCLEGLNSKWSAESIKVSIKK
ncbi:vacuolar protein sorting-associated protein 16B [Phlebotomus argentipes]|uniref:vacuolar protein sorting-associated protein 16B n=1 Tax=Phlebotomus argentipes TaxID=94469 RepID=UPI002892AF65|nr:vacuolar protein sorting-associated protein 16B [Phlebotomus argentipes]